MPNFIESVGEAFFVLSLFHVVTGVHHGVGNDIRRHAVMDASESLCMELQRRDVSAIGINFNEIIYMHQPEVFVDNFWIVSAYLFDRFHQRWFTSIIWLKTVRCSFFYKNGKMASFTIFVEVDDVFSFSTSNVENNHYRIRTQIQI